MLGEKSRQWNRIVAVSVGPLCVAGCLLVNDFDEVSGGGGLVPEASVPDSSSGDPDAADGGSSDAGFRCEDHRECLTFDEGELEVNGWSGSESGNGSLRLDESLYVSPPAGARTRFEATDGGGAPQNGAIMLKNLVVEPAPAHMAWGFDLNLGECSLPSGSGVGSVTLTSIQTGDVAFGLILNTSNRATVGHSDRQTMVFTGKQASQPLPRRRWAHLDFDLTVSAEASTMRMFIDGELFLDGAFPAAPPSSKLLLNVGSLSSGRVNECDVAYDNYYFDVLP